jgi:uncharacterized membrane protein YkvA (DUF1232 family)
VEIPIWAQVVIVLILVWTVLVAALVIVGRVVLARELALLLPNLIRLFKGLVQDPRVPLRAKIVLALAGLWLASPIDLIPEFVPLLGSLDDAIVAAFALRFALGATNAAVVREHWHGDALALERIIRVVSLGRRRAPRALP